MSHTPSPTSPIDPERLAELHQLLAKAVPADLPDEQRLPMLLELADLCIALGQVKEAEDNLRQQALPIAKRLGEIPVTLIILGKLADLLAARGELDAAIEQQQERRQLAEGQAHDATLAHIKFSIAQLRLQRGDHRQGAAQAIFEDLADAYSIVKKLGQADGVGAIGLVLAQMLALGGDRAAALKVADTAEAAFRHLDDHANVEQVQSLRDAISGMAS